MYPRVFRSCGYKLHIIEKIFKNINAWIYVVTEIYILFSDWKIHGVIKTQNKYISAKARQ